MLNRVNCCRHEPDKSRRVEHTKQTKLAPQTLADGPTAWCVPGFKPASSSALPLLVPVNLSAHPQLVPSRRSNSPRASSPQLCLGMRIPISASSYRAPDSTSVLRPIGSAFDPCALVSTVPIIPLAPLGSLVPALFWSFRKETPLCALRWESVGS